MCIRDSLGLNAASGPYTALLDQDDTVELSALDHIAAVLRLSLIHI